MKIITGGAGFIGSAICWRLNTLGIEDIIIVDTDMHGDKQKNLANLKYLDFMHKDLFLGEVLQDSFHHKVDTIYHLGACSSTTEDDMEYLIENNVEYSKHLANWCIKNDTRFIYASSGATYGNGELGFDDEIELISKLCPLNKYGLSKHIFDQWILEKNLIDKVVGLKYFNVFGPNENHKDDMKSMVNKAYNQIKNTGKLKLFSSLNPKYKDGEQKRDFIYVKDAVEMTIFFDNTNEKARAQNGIYNIGCGKAHTWLEVANSIFNSLGKEPDIEFIDMPENIMNQYQYFSEAKIGKLRKAGYTDDTMSLENAINDYVQNYLIPDKYLSV